MLTNKFSTFMEVEMQPPRIVVYPNAILLLEAVKIPEYLENLMG